MNLELEGIFRPRPVEIDDGERQMILLALAHLQIERPGWEYALTTLAAKLDNVVDDKPQLYTQFFTLRKKRVSNSLPEVPTEETLKEALWPKK